MGKGGKEKPKCAYCGKEINDPAPFRCPYCNKIFCSKHKKPEEHECEYRIRIRTQRIRQKMKDKGISYTFTEKTFSFIGRKIVYSIIIALIMIAFVLISLSI